MKTKLLTLVLYAYAAVSLLVSVPLMLWLGPAASVKNSTSVRLLGAALFSLSIGAMIASRDPTRNKGLLAVEVVFTALATLALVNRHFVYHSLGQRAWLILPAMLVCLVLLLVLFPWGNRPSGGDN